MKGDCFNCDIQLTESNDEDDTGICNKCFDAWWAWYSK